MNQLLILVAFGTISLILVLSAGFFMYLLHRTNQKHLESVLDRFLSRSFDQYAMTDMVRKEVAVDQQEEPVNTDIEQKLIDEWLASGAAKPQQGEETIPVS